MSHAHEYRRLEPRGNSPRRSEVVGTQHVAILQPRYLDLIVAGRKSIEARLTRTLRAPIGAVRSGDWIHLKACGGPIAATMRVARVLELRELNPTAVAALRGEFNDRILAPYNWWRERSGSRFGVLLWLKLPRKPIAPPSQVPRQYGGAWLTLRDSPATMLHKCSSGCGRSHHSSGW